LNWGEEFELLGLVLNAQTGALTVYVLDGEAEQSVRVAQAEIEVAVCLPRRMRGSASC
jgi:hypothetical protein